MDETFPWTPLFSEGHAVKLELAATKVYSKLFKLTCEPQY
jgi:hypothetical protein